MDTKLAVQQAAQRVLDMQNAFILIANSDSTAGDLGLSLEAYEEVLRLAAGGE